MSRKIEEILAVCDHTLLLQTSTWEEIRGICDDAMKYHTASVCIPPCYVRQAADYMQGRIPVCTVIGFPNGNHTTACKVFETQDAVKNGADFIKTSTGFSTAGATFADIELFAKHIGAGVRMKAAGGISSIADAEKFMELGASRLGTSRIVKLVKEQEHPQG